jgi:hypothetical protein
LLIDAERGELIGFALQTDSQRNVLLVALFAASERSRARASATAVPPPPANRLFSRARCEFTRFAA